MEKGRTVASQDSESYVWGGEYRVIVVEAYDDTSYVVLQEERQRCQFVYF